MSRRLSSLRRGKSSAVDPLVGHGGQGTLEMEQCATCQTGKRQLGKPWWIDHYRRLLLEAWIWFSKKRQCESLDENRSQSRGSMLVRSCLMLACATARIGHFLDEQKLGVPVKLKDALNRAKESKGLLVAQANYVLASEQNKKTLERLVSSTRGALALLGRSVMPTAHIALIYLCILVRQVGLTNLVSAVVLASSSSMPFNLVSLIGVGVWVGMLEHPSVSTSSPSRFERVAATAAVGRRGGHKAAGLL